MTTIVCVGTGPSLTVEQVDAARAKGFTLYGCNNAFKLAPDLECLYAINEAWWEHYYDEIADLPAGKFCGHRPVCERFGLQWVDAREGRGLAPADAPYVHHGNGSGFTLLGLAHQAKPARIILLGYDAHYAPDYDGASKKVGSGPRHFFGEYPKSMQHWPKHRDSVQKGLWVGQIQRYRDVADQRLCEIVNATPGSAIDAFPMRQINEC